MIRFQTIRWRNFLSTGNAWNEIQLNAVPTTLIVGDNGSGKSTILDALCFALFGSAFRNINKPQLLNSINQKDCEVEVDFQIGKREYKVRRGIRPNFFEIYQDGVLLNQDASAKDYQQVLEQQIIKFSKRAFTQIVILGSASFTPFMQLPAGGRREIIEDLLDIKLFSAMNRVLKDKTAALLVELSNLETSLAIAKEQAKTQKKYLDTIKQDKETKINDNKASIKEHKAQLKVLDSKAQKLRKEISELTDSIAKQSTLRSSLRDLEISIAKSTDSVAKYNKDIQFYAINDVCPTCQQDIEPTHKCSIVEKKEIKKAEVETELERATKAADELKQELNKIEKIGQKISDRNSDLSTIDSQIFAAKSFIDKLESEIEKLEANTANITVEQEKMREIAQRVVDAMERRSTLNEEREYHAAAAPLLKDTGFKTKVIKQYLPIINKLVNKYLQAMDLFIQFELDESFNETIKSRHRDEFTYASFSEGEKQRINLALLFAWRAVASLRNTTNTNLLLFDEVLDGSLDATAVEYFLTMVKEIGVKTNIFVITHKQDLFVDKFDRVIKVQKVGGYSILEGQQ